MSLQTDILIWFAKNQRPLPWRKHYRPYEVWVSEIMLQQTQVETVLPYYERWMKLFPTVKSLAKADQEKVLKVWQGLGYYSRARNLHETAKAIAKDFDGKFPSDFDAILSLKGIGRYSAGAIASIAFNQEKPVVDANVLRVLSRVYAIGKSIDVPKNREEFWALEEKLIPKGHARDFNQALMELGALICARNPDCPICPLRKHCRAYKENRALDFPVRKKRRQTVKVNAAAVVLKRSGEYFIHRRPQGEIMGGLWEFPEWKLSKNACLELEEIEKCAMENLKKTFHVAAGKPEHLGTIKRNYTHHDEVLEVFLVNAPSPFNAASDWPSAWSSKKDFARYPFSSAHSKIAKLVY